MESPEVLLFFFALEHLQQCSICDPGKIFFTSKFSYLFSCNPTNKTEAGAANRRGITNSKQTNDSTIRNTNQ
jgi:hypothetical protein